MAESPRPIDPRGPRFNQAVLTVALLGAFLLDARLVVPVFAVVLLLGAAFGPRYGPLPAPVRGLCPSPPARGSAAVDDYLKAGSSAS